MKNYIVFGLTRQNPVPFVLTKHGTMIFSPAGNSPLARKFKTRMGAARYVQRELDGGTGWTLGILEIEEASQ
jgi:hypothetical protein